MNRTNFLPSAIQVMTWKELATYVNTEHQLDSAVLVVAPVEQAMAIPRTDWNRVTTVAQVDVRPGSDGCSYPMQGVAKTVADFVADLARSADHKLTYTLAVCVYDGEKERFNKPQYAYTIAAAIADWATGSNAMEYYAALDEGPKPDGYIYAQVSAELAKHTPEFSETL